MDTVDLELSPLLYMKLARYAYENKRKPDDVAEAVLCDAMDPPEPTRKKVKLNCTKCGFTPHRFARSVIVKGAGEFAHLYGCSKCYRLRRYGTVDIMGEIVERDDAELPAATLTTKAPKGPTALWLVPMPAMETVMEPGVPEALQ